VTRGAVYEDFAAGIAPHWRRYVVGSGALEPTGSTLCFVNTDASSRQYTDAQLDDYQGLPRRRFLWRPPLRMTVRARFSHPTGELRGTAGFGFWNDPFLMTGARMPALPRAIAEVLQGGDFYPLDEQLRDWGEEVIGPIKAFAWPLIVQSAGLVELAETRLQLTAAGKKALTAPPQRTIRRAWNRWLKTTLLDEFNRVETIKGQRGKGKRHLTAVAGRRAAIVAALCEFPAHTWIALDEFSRFMRAAGYTFEVSRDLWSLYIADANYGSLGYSGFGEWHIVQERYILALLFEYVATLGLIDVAYIPPAGARTDYGDRWGVDDLSCLSRYDGLLSFRINGLGAWCLGIAEAYEPAPFEERSVLKVLPNLEVVATEVLSPADTLFLERIATPISDLVWRIERSKLIEAAEQGYAVSDVVDFLRAKSENDLPDNVAIFFQEAAERTSSLVARGPALLIEAQDEVLAQLIAHDSRTRSLCMVAGERHLVVPAEAESTFRRALHELGYGVSASKG